MRIAIISRSNYDSKDQKDQNNSVTDLQKFKTTRDWMVQVQRSNPTSSLVVNWVGVILGKIHQPPGYNCESSMTGIRIPVQSKLLESQLDFSRSPGSIAVVQGLNS